MAAAISHADALAALDGFDWGTWRDGFREIFEPFYRQIVVDQGTRTVTAVRAQAHKADPFKPDAPYAKRAMTTYIAARVTQIDETTRQWIREAIVSTIDGGEGASMTELAGRIIDAVQDSRAFDPARALTIARTETAVAYNHGTALAYKQEGIDTVVISDGDGDEACAEADGQVWTVAAFLANPIEHPNCERSASPADPNDEVDVE